jgi:glutamate---cysteine ligase / carboxylate-amine ligase
MPAIRPKFWPVPDFAARGARLAAFQAYGIELEYMIVRRDTLEVAPIAERALDADPAWSNELVAHVVELKNPRPSADLRALSRFFHEEIQNKNALLERSGARLLPSAMHPWMHPRTETRLWTGEDAEIYRTYDRIFDCRTHGWANLQSTHINLPFHGEREFVRLHAAVRLALPLLPAIAASSPFAEGRFTGWLDYRLHTYRTNASRVPAMNGRMIPEPVVGRAQYERDVLHPLYEALAPLDAEGILAYEWANARGAIARFDRDAIEIRVLDVQECPAADIALAAAVIDLVRLFYEENRGPQPDTGELVEILLACMRDGERARIDTPLYGGRGEAREVWAHLARRMRDAPHRRLWGPYLEFVLERGPLARRLLGAAGTAPSRTQLARSYAQLGECLAHGRLFVP